MRARYSVRKFTVTVYTRINEKVSFMKVIGKENAIRYAQEHCTHETERNIERIERSLSYRIGDKKKLESVFNTEGVEVVEVYEFSFDWDNWKKEPTYEFFDQAYFAVHLLELDEFAHVYEISNSGRFGLYLFRENQTLGRLNGFEFEEPTPRYIGKGTKKKVREWFEYLHREDEAKRRYIQSANEKNRYYKEKILSKFPDARMNVLEDGWMVECEFTVGYVIVRVTVGHNGNIYSEKRVDILSFPRLYDLLEIKE